ncbi:Spy/CpxP family protein refolding chaperone [Runella sp.]|jgi:Spy/CpxP family protein refolding chaperone|uniref:Spy/CpxP family protein refolding chaperone n=1 Tax=Runella sp. TaxID=1960881 RepID=UPI002608797F|nr:Spy/CpxP family protein refolding chaperone [Runella sp.]
MNNFFQNRYVWLVILGLLVFNLGLLGWIWFSPQNRPREGGNPASFLEKKLNFTKEQKEQFRLLREDHHKKTQAIRDSVRQMKRQFFEQLGKPMSESDVERVTADIAKKMARVDKITFQHFREVRQLCTPAQQQKFDEVIDEMLERLAASAEGRGRPPRGAGPPQHSGPSQERLPQEGSKPKGNLQSQRTRQHPDSHRQGDFPPEQRPTHDGPPPHNGPPHDGPQPFDGPPPRRGMPPPDGPPRGGPPPHRNPPRENPPPVDSIKRSY